MSAAQWPSWSYLPTAVGVFGLWLAGRHDRRRWMVGIGAQFLWMADAPDEPKLYVVSSVRAAGPTQQEIPDSDAGLPGESAMTSVPRFVLNRHGRVFHLAGCDMAGKAQPWAWIEPLTNSQIRTWIEPLGIRPCRRCDPLEGK